MTAPTPPPGWHPDPVDPNLVRYWDGVQRIGDTRPKSGQTPNPPTKKGGVGKVLLIVAAVLVVMGILGTVFGGNDNKDDKPAAAAAATTSATTTAVPTTTQVPAPRRDWLLQGEEQLRCVGHLERQRLRLDLWRPQHHNVAEAKRGPAADFTG